MKKRGCEVGLVVIYSEEDVPLLRFITAFDAEGSLRDEYYRRRGI